MKIFRNRPITRQAFQNLPTDDSACAQRKITLGCAHFGFSLSRPSNRSGDQDSATDRRQHEPPKDFKLEIDPECEQDCQQVRIPTKPIMHSNLMPITYGAKRRRALSVWSIDRIRQQCFVFPLIYDTHFRP